MRDQDPQQDRIRRLRSTIARDERAVRAAEEQGDHGEAWRLRGELANRRAYLAELLGPPVPLRDLFRTSRRRRQHFRSSHPATASRGTEHREELSAPEDYVAPE
jgi:hypothetical protein